MNRLQRLVFIHHTAAEDAAWEAFFTGRDMTWLTGEREMHRSDIARQREQIQKAQHTEGATGRDPTDWIILAIGVVLLACLLGGVIGS